MIVQLGNTQYNTAANLSKDEFTEVFKGKLNINMEQAWKLVKPHYSKPVEERKFKKSKKEN